MNHGSPIDNKFHYGNYQNFDFQTSIDNIYQMGNEWIYGNPFPYFQFQLLANPLIKQETGYNANFNPILFTNQ